MQYFNYKEEKTDMNMSPDEILKALEKAVAKKEKEHTIGEELRSCERQIKDALGIVYILYLKIKTAKQVCKTLSER